MNVDEQMIKVIGVNKDRIRECALNKGEWIIPLKLSMKPDDSWERYFYEIHRKSGNSRKKDVKIVNDCMEMNFSDKEDPQETLDYIKKEIEDANVAYKEVYLRKIKVQEDLKIFQQRQVDMLQKIKDASDKLKF